MQETNKFSHWLEKKWVAPSFAGWLLGVIAICFFGAATNTMAGWLYVISGVILAILGLGAVIPMRSLKPLKLRRLPIEPVSAGEQLIIELEIENPTPKPKTLIHIKDCLPSGLSQPTTTAIETIPPQSKHRWTYYPTAQKRGIYHWHELELRTGTPLGVCWCRRTREIPTKAIVYPTVLPLTHCPLIDSIGEEDSTKLQSDRLYLAATEGITKTLRQYRFGDPTRLIHWRTSARFGDLQVRELEIITGGQEVILCLDSAPSWEEEAFELAVIAAASLYFYASRAQLNVKLWTAGAGLLHGNRVVLETLAAVFPGEDNVAQPPSLPLIWLTQNPSTIDSLPPGSRWLLFPQTKQPVINPNLRGLVINSEQSLQLQLQKLLS
ncbi:MAG: DUF58 domain-containing protein [Gomphosphaeria aponina SAG 52.96 = DSM 107014]|uniref:DUF58 domain-containing protein n=1 Tax=Gomphosphaeria aponina SAG 52.96 = DSM 107014 TaxID=1521640 RepID=A0A941GX62_9CHRO|nr:DUF58 domain-containing protein [Gomphosphaeria aponina SAG 52.96 = DSM 107014]